MPPQRLRMQSQIYKVVTAKHVTTDCEVFRDVRVIDSETRIIQLFIVSWQILSSKRDKNVALMQKLLAV